ncbi:hypothetical protein A3A84_01420 [Candidatus Collierbacteria bacterium RIFCSPLOWO2_01_FULL_50_23]|uniref:Putative gluconeogenesis factor n=1 Tax=Candidatus Collierbacteria bacterium RIFCSPHIGHO2_01_FULL_50_25 TaxID=1817722 RepID=A0A1F5EZ93_9BACT|nr:MAG: hypothetical protein A2703_01825 [Candidatus Collierbacteria bacterium RIFCSPHIGHO2_01_FULL_50_25]OGD75058.1 MAG: hypothetical protein A3A84_01420 [Candidatus Collierbacteria bacterium RIFCSPLOWO2_01_FULL_50_23]
MVKPKKKVVVIGGGTGTYTTLVGLRKYPIDIAVIVSMTDSGGSNRVIRDEFGLLPTSDLRQAMVALAGKEGEDLLRKLFTYRYSQGTGIAGMTFGNLFMVALTDIMGSQKEAIKETCRLLHVEGSVIPVTYDDAQLVARYDNGKQVMGEHHIDEPDLTTGQHRIVDLEVFPKSKANPEALEAIQNADLIIMGPGDLYTSLLCNLVVGGVAKTVRKSKAKKVFVMNLMTKFGQTTGFTASDYLFELYKYLSGGIIQTILINKPFKLKRNIFKRYREEKAEIVVDDLDFSNQSPKPKVIRADLVSDLIYEKPKGDVLVRSLIRHDPDKLAKALMNLV